MKSMGFIVIFLLGFITNPFIRAGVSNPRAYQTYIDKYKDLAIKEMHYSGIPASIILSQALLESLYGTSRLAIQANNHFGIKCKMEWTGSHIAISDDAPDECFRAYSSVEHSYRDHSNFIRFNRLGIYDHLFNLNPTDYKTWAKGIKAAGYATLKDYDTQLLAIIRQFHLHQYDMAGWVATGESLPSYIRRLNEELSFSFTDVVPEYLNGVKVKKPRQIPFFTYAGNPHQKAEVHYKSLKTNSPIHIFSYGDTMESLATLYAINLEELYALNRLIYGAQPALGEKIYLFTPAPQAPRLPSKPASCR